MGFDDISRSVKDRRVDYIKKDEQKQDEAHNVGHNSNDAVVVNTNGSSAAIEGLTMHWVNAQVLRK